MRLTRLVGAVVLSAVVAAGLARWSSRQDRWVRLDFRAGGRSVTLALDADGPIQGWLENATPRLLVTCSSGAVVAFQVRTGLAAAVEPGDLRTVRYWFDGDDDTLTEWRQSPDRQVLSAPAGAAQELATRLAAAQRFFFAYLPFNAEPARATFTVAGFDSRWKEALRVCGTPAGK